ncbi:MAG: hypothetical protein KDK70_03435 [Myxococcales bacterium]|nr:hypothetical protein [Myxococcales bacterium]
MDGACIAICEPACADNELCVEGECQSRCNPICAFGQVCTDAGECLTEAELDPPQSEPRELEFAYEVPPEPREPRGVPMLTAGAAMVGIGLMLVFGSTFWRFTLGELEDDSAPAQRKRRTAAGLAVGGAVLAVAGTPLLVIGVQRYRDSKYHALLRRLRPLVGAGPHGATAGLRMRF